MKPDLPVILKALGDALQGELSAQLMGTYAGQQVFRMSALMPSFAIEFERAAARRVEENKALRELFAGATSLVTDAQLRQELALAVASRDDDLRITALQAANDHLRALLIRLQVWAEAQGTAQAHDLLDSIWRELRRSTERRALPMDRL